MREPPPSQLTVQERPYLIWFFGLVFTGMGLVFMFSKTGTAALGYIFFAIGSLILAFTPQVTVTIDKNTGIVTLHNRSLIRSSFREIYLNEISSVELESSRSSRGGSTYRIAFALKDGSSIPMVGYYSSGHVEKDAKVRMLRKFIGISEASVAATTASPATHPGLVSPQQGTTSGVSWTIDQVSYGGVPVTRWISTDFRTPDGFLFLVQKPKGGFNLPGGLLGGVSRLLYEQLFKVYGFQPETLPGLDTAVPLEPPEPRLEPFYASLTTRQAEARQILTPWALIPLVQWAERHPLEGPQSNGRVGQLVVMFSPEGTVLACSSASTQKLSAELEALGVDLVKSQGGI